MGASPGGRGARGRLRAHPNRQVRSRRLGRVGPAGGVREGLSAVDVALLDSGDRELVDCWVLYQ